MTIETLSSISPFESDIKTGIDAVSFGRLPFDLDSVQPIVHQYLSPTKLIHHPDIDKIFNKKIFFKNETTHPTGSFKVRGALYSMHILRDMVDVFVAYSSGNHGAAIAYAAQIMDKKAIIVMPEDAPKRKIENVQSYDAEIIFYNRARDCRKQIASSIAAQIPKSYLIPPYDSWATIAGQTSIGLEIMKQLKDEYGIQASDIDHVLTPCGGGGLASGLLLGLCQYDYYSRANKTEYQYKQQPSLWLVEPKDFDDARRSMFSKKIVANTNRLGSICDSIMTDQLGQIPFDLLSSYDGTRTYSVTDEQVMDSMHFLYKKLGLVVEPGGAVAASAARLLAFADKLDGDHIVVVLSGRNVDIGDFEDIYVPVTNY